jgi:F-type H+-transporting ATPase subunit gamma
MSKIAHIKRRIKAVKNTKQITKAMQLVAASKMKRAQDKAVAGRAYSSLLAQMIQVAITHSATPFQHPFMQAREVKRRGVLVLSTDKGLCGALNANLFRLLASTPADTRFISVGRKAKQFLSRSGRKLMADFTVSDKVGYGEIRPMVELLVESFLSGEVDSVEVAFPRFINTMYQEPMMLPLLPIVDLESCLEKLKLKGDDQALVKSDDQREMRFEPSLEHLLSELPMLFVRQQVYQFMLSTKASEHSARMVAMKSASDNATQLMQSLTLKFNKARQAAITQEILEIAAATASATR